MKIGILTFHYSNNYGALLQTYALSTILLRLGFEPIIINRIPENQITTSVLANFKFIISQKIHDQFNNSFNKFRKSHLKSITKQIVTEKELKYIVQQFDAVIVGSDQVWRTEYTKGLGLNNFLDFVPDNIKKISYAASFGNDEFDGTYETITKVKKLLARFDAISVREESGVSICKNTFNVKAIQLVDPTLLLYISDYRSIINNKKQKIKNKFVAIYLLDNTKKKNELVEKFAIKNNLKIHNISRKSTTNFSLKRLDCNIGKFYYPSFPSWLQGIKDAEYVITDSFHGVVFSILFNKQFICVANRDRGLTRMTSILSQFGLEDRMVDDLDVEFYRYKLKRIEYEQVNQILNNERYKSIEFLIHSINS